MPTDREFMEMAIQEMEKSRGEPNRISPKVGAVAVQGENFLASAHRGEDDFHKEHAGFRLLEVKLKTATLAGSTVFTTLEPCMVRGEDKTPCARRLEERRVKKVVIGTLDPDPSVHGKGQMYLLEHGIEVANFEADLTNRILEANREFIHDRQSPGMTFDPDTAKDPHPKGEIKIKGRFRPRSFNRDRLALFTRRGKLHWPQGRFVENRDGTWECMITENQVGETTILAAQVDPNCELWINYYLKSTKELKDPNRWIGLEIERLPSGIQVHQQIVIKII